MLRRDVFIIRSDEVGWMAVQAAILPLAGVSLAGEATSIRQAEQALASLPHDPDLILSAAYVAGSSVVPLLWRLRRGTCLTSRFVIFASTFRTDDLLAFGEIGKVSCLLWGDLCRLMLPHCLATLSGSDVIVSSQAAVSSFIEVLQYSSRAQTSSVRLTEREKVILARLGEGYTREHIAQAEGVSIRTVNRIVSTLEEKLDAPNAFVLGARAVQLGLIPASPTDHP